MHGDTLPSQVSVPPCSAMSGLRLLKICHRPWASKGGRFSFRKTFMKFVCKQPGVAQLSLNLNPQTSVSL